MKTAIVPIIRNKARVPRKKLTDLCVFTLKSVLKYYTKKNSSVLTWFLDASKSFDKMNHHTLFQKLLDRKTPILLFGILLFCYTKQILLAKWGTGMYDYINVSKFVRQGGILSLNLYSMCVHHECVPMKFVL